MPVYSLKDAVIHISDVDGRRGSNTVEVTVEEGDLSYTERRPANIILDRGSLHSARKGNEESVECSFSIAYRTITVDEDPSPYGALRGVEGASAWVSTNHESDKYGCDLEVILTNADGSTADEYLYFTPFLIEEIEFTEGEEMSVLSFTGRALIVSPISPDSAIQFYPLRGATGATERDQGVNALDLTDNGTVVTATGIRGKAKTFNGTSMYLDRSDESDLQFGDQDYSGFAWVNPDDLTTDRVVLSKAGASDGLREMLVMYDFSETDFVFWHYTDGAGTKVTVALTITEVVDTWYFLKWYHDAAADTISLGYNDNDFVTPQATGGGGNTGAGDFIIGQGHQEVALEEWSGMIQNVGIIRGKVLSAGQFNRIYNMHRGQGFPLNY